MAPSNQISSMHDAQIFNLVNQLPAQPRYTSSISVDVRQVEHEENLALV